MSLKKGGVGSRWGIEGHLWSAFVFIVVFWVTESDYWFFFFFCFIKIIIIINLKCQVQIHIVFNRYHL